MYNKTRIKLTLDGTVKPWWTKS